MRPSATRVSPEHGSGVPSYRPSLRLQVDLKSSVMHIGELARHAGLEPRRFATRLEQLPPGRPDRVPSPARAARRSGAGLRPGVLHATPRRGPGFLRRVPLENPGCSSLDPAPRWRSTRRSRASSSRSCARHWRETSPSRNARRSPCSAVSLACTAPSSSSPVLPERHVCWVRGPDSGTPGNSSSAVPDRPSQRGRCGRQIPAGGGSECHRAASQPRPRLPTARPRSRHQCSTRRASES
jgi:hypothetical protein